MLEFILLFAGGLALLLKGSDFLVEAAAKIAKIFGVSDIIIGLTIVSIGTTLPEATSSLVAGFAGKPELAMGTITGSVIANIALILAIAAVISGKIVVERKAVEKSLFILLASSVLFFYFSLDNVFSFSEGIVFLALFAFYLALVFGFLKRASFILDYEGFIKNFFDTAKFGIFNAKTYFQVMRAGLDPKTYRDILSMHVWPFEHELGKTIERAEDKKAKEIFRKSFISSLFNQLLFLALGVLGIFYGSHMLVDGSIGLARSFNVPESIVGLFLTAIGTSLPELGIAVTAARKNFTGILLGNAIGANISDLLLVGGITAVFSTFSFNAAAFILPFFFMIMLVAALNLFAHLNYSVNRLSGAMLLALYALFAYYANFAA